MERRLPTMHILLQDHSTAPLQICACTRRLTQVLCSYCLLTEGYHEIITCLSEFMDRLRGGACHHTHFVVILGRREGGRGREEGGIGTKGIGGDGEGGIGGGSGNRGKREGGKMEREG